MNKDQEPTSNIAMLTDEQESATCEANKNLERPQIDLCQKSNMGEVFLAEKMFNQIQGAEDGSLVSQPPKGGRKNKMPRHAGDDTDY